MHLRKIPGDMCCRGQVADLMMARVCFRSDGFSTEVNLTHFWIEIMMVGLIDAI